MVTREFGQIDHSKKEEKKELKIMKGSLNSKKLTITMGVEYLVYNMATIRMLCILKVFYLFLNT